MYWTNAPHNAQTTTLSFITNKPKHKPLTVPTPNKPKTMDKIRNQLLYVSSAPSYSPPSEYMLSLSGSLSGTWSWSYQNPTSPCHGKGGFIITRRRPAIMQIKRAFRKDWNPPSALVAHSNEPNNPASVGRWPVKRNRTSNSSNLAYNSPRTMSIVYLDALAHINTKTFTQSRSKNTESLETYTV